MLIYYLLYTLFIFSALFNSFTKNSKRTKKKTKLFFGLVSFFLILLVGFRELGVGVDDINYLNYFKQSKNGRLRKDITFYFLSNIVSTINYLFVMFAVISISLKAKFIVDNIRYVGVIFLLYFTSSFLLHDFVQIRAAVASGLLLWILYFAGEKKFLISAILIGIAVSFHLSAVIFIPLIFLKNANTKFTFLVFAIISLLIAFFYPLDIYSLAQFLPDYVYKRVQVYLIEDNYEANLFNPIAIIHYIFAVIIFINWEKIVNYSTYSVFVVKTFLISLYVFLIFNNSGIAFRLYELLVIVQLPLIDIFLRTINKKIFILSCSILLSIVYLYYYLIKNPIVNPYSFFFT